MGKRRLPTQEVPAEDRLRSVGQQAERFGKLTEIAVENLIVIGASAGGVIALKRVVRELSRRFPHL